MWPSSSNWSRCERTREVATKVPAPVCRYRAFITGVVRSQSCAQGVAGFRDPYTPRRVPHTTSTAKTIVKRSVPFHRYCGRSISPHSLIDSCIPWTKAASRLPPALMPRLLRSNCSAVILRAAGMLSLCRSVFSMIIE